VDAVLTTDNLARVYGVAAVTGVHQGQTYIVPWALDGAVGGGNTSAYRNTGMNANASF
jgi:hypothetical protein